jgi:hypothetical protein
MAMTDLRDDELVWMHNAETGGWFECPAAAVQAWQARGWEVADAKERPAEANPVVEELAAFQAERAKAAAAKPAKRAAKSTAPASSGDEEKE